MSDLQTTFETPGGRTMTPAVWQDGKGVMHRAVGAEVHRGIRLLWTACGQSDVPGNQAWIVRPDDRITCAECRKVAPLTNPHEAKR